MLCPFTEEFVDYSQVGSLSVVLGSIPGDFEEPVVYGHHYLGVRESDITWYYANRCLHTVTVYGMTANEKKDAPYSKCCKSGRKTEATKWDIQPKIEAEMNCICGKTHGVSHRLSPGRKWGGVLGTSPFHRGTSIPTCSRRMHR